MFPPGSVILHGRMVAAAVYTGKHKHSAVRDVPERIRSLPGSRACASCQNAVKSPHLRQNLREAPLLFRCLRASAGTATCPCRSNGANRRRKLSAALQAEDRLQASRDLASIQNLKNCMKTKLQAGHVASQALEGSPAHPWKSGDGEPQARNAVLAWTWESYTLPVSASAIPHGAGESP